jgi:glycerol-3-phosphate acyltransferase PlsX
LPATYDDDTPLRIAVDAMGGDHAPAEIVRGVLAFLTEDQSGAHVLLVGDPQRIEAEITAAAGGLHPFDPACRVRLKIVAASQVIDMDEHPTDAMRDKRDASLVVATALTARGDADACISAGNTGACMVAAAQLLGKVGDIRRPAIATLMPTEAGAYAIVVDAGANVDCKPSQLVQFALLGALYMEKSLGVPNPRVGLLSNGAESAKGNELVREVHPLLAARRPHLNFIGNVEGNHVFEGDVDVVVCDGFVGNVLLKGAEGTGKLAMTILARDARAAENEETREVLLAALLRLRQRLDYAEVGGAPLLGLNGLSFIAHGRSDAKAIANGIRQAVKAARSGYVAAIKEALQREGQAG